ncbi:MAG: hypothetical protein WC610_01165 [Patescibacteria group bacterium]
MFQLFRQKKCPICGMAATPSFISRYGEKFCSENCLKKYEEQNQIAGVSQISKKGGCCH